MIQFILMLLGLAFGSNNANTATYDNNQTTLTVQSDTNPETGIDLGTGVEPGEGGTGGDTGQTPPR